LWIGIRRFGVGVCGSLVAAAIGTPRINAAIYSIAEGGKRKFNKLAKHAGEGCENRSGLKHHEG
jgi:hypothetical protein